MLQAAVLSLGSQITAVETVQMMCYAWGVKGFTDLTDACSCGDLT